MPEGNILLGWGLLIVVAVLIYLAYLDGGANA